MNRDSLHSELAALARRLLSPLQPIPTGVSPRLTPLAGVRCVLFDVYGTLLVSAAGEVGTELNVSAGDAATAALEDGGFRLLERVAAAKVAEGLPRLIRAVHAQSEEEFPEVDICAVWQDLLAELEGQHLIEGEISAAAVRRVALSYECRINPVWPMPGAQAVLERLQQAGILLGIVSNAQFYTPIVIEAVFGVALDQLGFRMELCSFSYAMGVAKPSTRLFDPVMRALADYFGLSAGDCSYVGNDMRNDMWPAHQLGMKAVLFAGDQRSLRLREDDAKCASLQPDAVVTSMEQLVPLLEVSDRGAL